MRQQGIYIIRCQKTKLYYLGSSINIVDRWDAHRRALNNGQHHSHKLQEAWNTFGAQSFEFKFVKAVIGNLAALRDAEQVCLDQFKPHVYGYNISGLASRIDYTLDVRDKLSMSAQGNTRCNGRIASPSTKQKLSIAAIGHKNGVGRVLSLESCQKIGNHFRDVPLSADHIAKIRKGLGYG